MGRVLARVGSEEVLRAISEASVEGIILHHLGVIVTVNNAGATMFGCTPEEMIGRSVLDFTVADSREAVRASYEQEEATSYQIFAVRKDGSRFRAEIRSRNVRFDGETMRAAVLRDLSERDEVERQRDDSISLLRATIDSTADGLLVVDTAGRITLYNERFLQIWGIPPSVMTAASDEQAIAFVEKQLVDPASFRARIGALLRSPETESVDLIEFRDGRFIERYSRPQRVGDHVVGRVWSFRDATAKRRAERTLELAVQMRDEFLGIASHELFTPITSLGIAIRGLRDMGGRMGVAAMPAEQRDRLFATAERQVERLARLVQELLDVTRLDGGHFALSLGEVDLSDVARDAIEHLAPELGRAGVVVTLDAPEAVAGRWDRLRLEQVVTNLLSNALKFGASRPIEVLVRRVGPVAELSVRDHGIGIAADQQSLIFERFQRAVSSRHFAGLGLGLYITRQIVEGHGGVLGLTSAVGSGSTFTVGLPLSPEVAT